MAAVHRALRLRDPGVVADAEPPAFWSLTAALLRPLFPHEANLRVGLHALHLGLKFLRRHADPLLESQAGQAPLAGGDRKRGGDRGEQETADSAEPAV